MEELDYNKMSKEQIIQFKELLSKFIKSYSNKNSKISDNEWLKNQLLEEINNISNEDAEKMATEITDSINEYNKNLNSINESAKKGINKETWFANKIKESSTGMSINQFGNYLNDINKSLENANAQMLRTITTNTGDVSKCINLDGFIAEQHHVNMFNANAALNKSNYYAEVKVPGPGETYGKNSFDVVIKDRLRGNFKPIHQYQFKFGKDAKTTIQLLKNEGNITKYSNQQIVVPLEQVEEVRKAFPGKTITSCIGNTDKVNIQSTPLTKAQVKELQLKAQEKTVKPEIDWNAFKTKDLSIQIGKQASLMGLQSAAITTGFAMVSNALNGETIETNEVVELALRTGVDTGVKVATTGALKVGIEKGIISMIPKGTPAGTLANIVCVSIENIKILSKVATGELTLSQGLEQIGRNSTAMVYGLSYGATGMAIGAAVLSFVPIVGPFIGGIIGGTLGYMAGSKFGEVVFNGVKKVANIAKTMIKSGWEKLKATRRKLIDWIFG